MKIKKIQLAAVIMLFTIYIVTFFSGTAFAQERDTISFLHISDLHLIFDIDLFQKDLAENRSDYGNSVNRFKKFLKNIPKERGADFVVVTGDLIDIYEGELAKGGMLDFQAKQFSHLVDKSKVPVFLALGNHDITSFSWEDNSKHLNQNCAEQARTSWTRNANCFNKGIYYSRVFKVGGTTYRLIFLNNAYNRFSSDLNITYPFVDKIQLCWLEEQLQESNDDVELIMMHIPITSESTQQESSCELYSVLARNPSAKLIFAGHNHKNRITDYSLSENNKITQIQTAGFAQSSMHWRLVRLTGNKVLVSLPGSSVTELELVIN